MIAMLLSVLILIVSYTIVRASWVTADDDKWLYFFQFTPSTQQDCTFFQEYANYYLSTEFQGDFYNKGNNPYKLDYIEGIRVNTCQQRDERFFSRFFLSFSMGGLVDLSSERSKFPPYYKFSVTNDKAYLSTNNTSTRNLLGYLSFYESYVECSDTFSAPPNSLPLQLNTLPIYYDYDPFSNPLTTPYPYFEQQDNTYNIVINGCVDAFNNDNVAAYMMLKYGTKYNEVFLASLLGLNSMTIEKFFVTGEVSDCVKDIPIRMRMSFNNACVILNETSSITSYCDELSRWQTIYDDSNSCSQNDGLIVIPPSTCSNDNDGYVLSSYTEMNEVYNAMCIDTGSQMGYDPTPSPTPQPSSVTTNAPTIRTTPLLLMNCSLVLTEAVMNEEDWELYLDGEINDQTQTIYEFIDTVSHFICVDVLKLPDSSRCGCKNPIHCLSLIYYNEFNDTIIKLTDEHSDPWLMKAWFFQMNMSINTIDFPMDTSGSNGEQTGEEGGESQILRKQQVDNVPYYLQPSLDADSVRVFQLLADMIQNIPMSDTWMNFWFGPLNVFMNSLLNRYGNIRFCHIEVSLYDVHLTSIHSGGGGGGTPSVSPSLAPESRNDDVSNGHPNGLGLVATIWMTICIVLLMILPLIATYCCSLRKADEDIADANRTANLDSAIVAAMNRGTEELNGFQAGPSTDNVFSRMFSHSAYQLVRNDGVQPSRPSYIVPITSDPPSSSSDVVIPLQPVDVV